MSSKFTVWMHTRETRPKVFNWNYSSGQVVWFSGESRARSGSSTSACVTNTLTYVSLRGHGSFTHCESRILFLSVENVFVKLKKCWATNTFCRLGSFTVIVNRCFTNCKRERLQQTWRCGQCWVKVWGAWFSCSSGYWWGGEDLKFTFSTSAFVTLMSASILSKYCCARSASLHSRSNLLLHCRRGKKTSVTYTKPNSDKPKIKEKTVTFEPVSVTSWVCASCAFIVPHTGSSVYRWRNCRAAFRRKVCRLKIK